MTVGSRVNPNYPVPGISQSSKGHRDNYSIIKSEIENLQSKTIQLVGSVTSTTILIDSGSDPIVIQTSLSNSQAHSPNKINTGNSITVIDSWSNTKYRSAKYLIQAVVGSNVEISETLLVQNQSSVYINTVNHVNAGYVLGVLSAAMSSSNVVVSYSGTQSNINLSIQTNYFTL
jgi:hypothetical protein